ncbi:MAG: hypothetical protein M0Z49_14985 [Chloroflexi bacterium]|nr:hypothetical protein [Chloroflexota bacterium]
MRELGVVRSVAAPAASSGSVPAVNPRATIGQPTAIATVPDPSGFFVSGQEMPGVGWRVLLATRHGWTPTVPPGTLFDDNWLDVAALVPMNVCLRFKSDCTYRVGLYATHGGGHSWAALRPGRPA